MSSRLSRQSRRRILRADRRTCMPGSVSKPRAAGQRRVCSDVLEVRAQRAAPVAGDTQFATARRVFQSRTAIAVRRAVLNNVDNASSVDSLLTGTLAAELPRTRGQFVCASAPPT